LGETDQDREKSESRFGACWAAKRAVELAPVYD
jgi:hypothetical protein